MDTHPPKVTEILAAEKPETMEESCNRFRAELLGIENWMRSRINSTQLTGEPAAQGWLVVRHLEDARMRLGKVIQHSSGGGISCWDSSRKPADDGR